MHHLLLQHLLLGAAWVAAKLQVIQVRAHVAIAKGSRAQRQYKRQRENRLEWNLAAVRRIRYVRPNGTRGTMAAKSARQAQLRMSGVKSCAEAAGGGVSLRHSPRAFP